MQANAFKRASSLVSPAKEVKASLRRLPRKTSTALIVHSILGLATAVSTLQVDLTKYVTGVQLNGDMLDRAKINLGPVFQHLSVLSKQLKVKLPSSGKKIKLKGETTTEGLLHLHRISTTLLDGVVSLTNGGLMTEKLDIEAYVLDEMRTEVAEFVTTVYAFTYTLLAISPSDILAEHFDYLKTVYGEERFAKKPKVVKPEVAPTVTE